MCFIPTKSEIDRERLQDSCYCICRTHVRPQYRSGGERLRTIDPILVGEREFQLAPTILEVHMAEEATVTASEEFAERLMGVLNGGALALMLSVGHRTGLFDTMASLPPSTSEQIAEAAGLSERYVREWLGAMTTGGIVDHDSDQLTFFCGLTVRAG